MEAIERSCRHPGTHALEAVTLHQALWIGVAQCVAMIPGVSRSAATIMGGMVVGLSRPVAAEFSFFLAIPTMAAASGYSLLKAWKTLGTADLERLITGSVGLATLQDTAGTGILPHVLMGVFDDVAAGATTENQFGALRMSAQRVLYTTAPAVQVDVNSAVVADVDAAVGAATGLIGFSARETAGATAQFHVVNGATGAAGTKITRVNLAANESAREWWWPGIDAASGISIDWVSGTIDIELYHLTLP